jgi:molybdenum-dependent DNA-binding transcriptional regulator ModE
MFGFLKRDPVKKLQQQHDALSNEAFQAQRNGDIRGYSNLTAKAEALREEIEQLQRNKNA